MGCFLEEHYSTSKEPNIIQDIIGGKDKNEDFKKLYNLIKMDKTPNPNQIPCIFKFLKIDTFFLGFQNLEGIYSSYKEEFEKRNLSKKDSVHASLLFSFSDDCMYFLDYYPETNNSSDGFVQFYDNENKGLRYKIMTMEEFIQFNNLCIIKLKSELKSEEPMTFYELFDLIYNENKWKYKDYDLEKNNCCHFAKFIIDKLKSKLLTGDKKMILFLLYI